MIEANIRIIEELKEFVKELKTDSEMRKAFINGNNSFTRERSLSLERLISFIINMPKKSLNIELSNFFESIDKPQQSCSKVAFSLQRQKLKNEFFQYWNAVLVNGFYHHHKKNIKRWKGFRIIGIDGSTGHLINTSELREHFGVSRNQSGSVALSRIMCVYDVLNNIIVGSACLPLKYSEPVILNTWISLIENDMLAIYDRGFQSFATIFLHLHQEQEVKFLMRCSHNFNKIVYAFGKSKQKSKIVEFPATYEAKKELRKHQYIVDSRTTVRVRLIKVKLRTGEIEILITNLYDESIYPTEIFQDLYFKRWGVETNYDKLKNKFQLEQFSGQKVNNILQDFYATIFVSNLQSLIGKQCEEDIELKTAHRKYKYKTNINISIGLMKNKIVRLFLDDNPAKILDELGSLFEKYIEPIRPERRYHRKTKLRILYGKYQTLTNYKRAI